MTSNEMLSFVISLKKKYIGSKRKPLESNGFLLEASRIHLNQVDSSCFQYTLFSVQFLKFILFALLCTGGILIGGTCMHQLQTNFLLYLDLRRQRVENTFKK